MSDARAEETTEVPPNRGLGVAPYAPYLASAAYLAAVLLFVDTAFKSNDNTTVVADLRAGTAVRLIGFVWNEALGLFYRATGSSVAWYGIALYAAHFFSLTLFLEALRRACRSRTLWWLQTPLYLVFYLPFLVEVGFNSTSILVAANGVLYLVARRSTSARVLGTAGLALFLSYQIRRMGIAAGAFLAPLVAFSLAGQPRGAVRRLLLSGLLLAGALAADAKLFRETLTEAERSYIAYEETRYRVGKHTRMPSWQKLNVDNRAARRANGWSQNDYDMWQQYFYIHEEKYNARKLENVLEHSEMPGVTWTHLTDAGPAVLDRHRFELLFLAALSLLAAAIAGRTAFFQTLFYAAWCTAGVHLMTELISFPVRVGAPILLACLGGSLLWILGQRRSDLSPSRLRAGRLLGLALAVWALYVAQGEARYRIGKVERERAEFAEDVATLEGFGRQTVFLFQPGRGLRAGRANPLSTFDPEFHAVRIGWNTFSPDFYESLAPLGVERASEILPAMVDNEHAFLVADAEFEAAFVKYVRETYDVRCWLQSRKRLSSDAMILRVNGGVPAARDGEDDEQRRKRRAARRRKREREGG